MGNIGAEVSERVDAVIAGSGATATAMAAKLAGAGRHVLILEAGPERQLSDMYSSQVWARRMKWGGAPIVSGGEQPIIQDAGTGWGTGGAAAHQYATWPRLHENDFFVRTRYGKSLDWPFGYSE